MAIANVTEGIGIITGMVESTILLFMTPPLSVFVGLALVIPVLHTVRALIR